MIPPYLLDYRNNYAQRRTEGEVDPEKVRLSNLKVAADIERIISSMNPQYYDETLDQAIELLQQASAIFREASKPK